MIKRIIWLIKNQKEIEKIVKKLDKKKDEKNYSIAGVPDFQQEYVQELLKKENN